MALTKGMPVVVSTNGYGVPVTIVANGYGIPVTIVAAGKFGLPVVERSSGGLPVYLDEGPNLLTGLPWIQGSNTIMTISGGKVRATATVGDSRVYKTVTGLTNGATYKLNGTIYRGTASVFVIFRISPTPDLPDGSIYEFIEGSASHTFINQTFVMTGTTMSIGIVADVNNTGEYSEIDENFSLQKVQ